MLMLEAKVVTFLFKNFSFVAQERSAWTSRGGMAAIWG